MGQFYVQPPPQPAAVHVPPNAAAQSNIPPNPIGSGAAFDAIRSMWLPETWAAQSGDTVASQFATPFVPPQSIAATNPDVLVGIRTAWPPEQWPVQRGAQIAAFFAAITPPPVAPVFVASPPDTLQIIRALWPAEEWHAQSEAAIASGIAQIQLPPIYVPWSTVPRFMALRSLWPTEDWRTQTGPKSAGWYPIPANYTPRPVPHREWLQWPQEQWAAQTGDQVAGGLATPPTALPYVNRWLSAALRSAWLPESWPAQTFPDIASGQASLPPPIPRPPSQFPISQWPVEFWGPQSGTRDAAIFASAAIITYMPFVVGELQDVAIQQLQALFGAIVTVQYVRSGAPVYTVVAQSIPAGAPVGIGTAVVLQVSLGPRQGPIPTSVVESILVCNIPVILSILPPDKKVIQ